MTRAAQAGALCFLAVFAAGFGLGALRVLVVAPRLGETGAVALELPVMLALSWAVAGWLIRRLNVAPRAADRLAMGAVGFSLLVLAEAALAVGGFGLTLAAHLGRYATPPGALGLAGQAAFGLIPWLRLAARG